MSKNGLPPNPYQFRRSPQQNSLTKQCIPEAPGAQMGTRVPSVCCGVFRLQRAHPSPLRLSPRPPGARARRTRLEPGAAPAGTWAPGHAQSGPGSPRGRPEPRRTRGRWRRRGRRRGWGRRRRSAKLGGGAASSRCRCHHRHHQAEEEFARGRDPSPTWSALGLLLEKSDKEGATKKKKDKEVRRRP